MAAIAKDFFRMKRLGLLVLPILVLFVFPAIARDFADEWLVSIAIDGDADRMAVRALRLQVVNVGEDAVTAFVSPEEWDRLAALGFRVDGIAPAPETSRADKAYHTYPGAIAAIEAAAASYPGIATLYEAGTSSQGRRLLAIKISDNPTVEEDEPELLFEGATHGNEKIGAEACLALINHLTTNFGVVPEVTDAVQQNEIWILPIVNPDGYVLGQRYNGQGTDVNRDYGWFWDDGSGSPTPSSSPESTALTRLALAHRFVAGASYHSGAECVNFPWDATPFRAPDDAEFQDLGNIYADASGYITWVTNGWDWYEIHGSSEDLYYGATGATNYIVELSDSFAPSNIDTYTAANLPAQMALIAASRRGVAGTVTDAATADPIPAVLSFQDGGMPFYADPDVGDFHRFAEPGTYTLVAWANGYAPASVPGVVVAGGVTRVDVELTPADEPITYGERVVQCERADPWGDYANPSLPTAAIGPPDGGSFSLGKGGWAVLDMGATTPIVDRPGADLTVREGDGTAEGYTVYAASDWKGPFVSLGTGTGTNSFDLAGSGLPQARFVKIVDDGDGVASAPDAGFELDSVETAIPCDEPVAGFLGEPLAGPAPLPVQFTLQTETPAGCRTGLSWDFGDGDGSAEEAPAHVYDAPGAYTVTLTITGPAGEDGETKVDYIVVTEGGDDDDVTDDDSVDDDSGDDDSADDDSGDDDSADDDADDDDAGDDDDSGGCGC
jgi:hypothetical protein